MQGGCCSRADDPDRVIVFEHALLYNFEGELTEEWRSADMSSRRFPAPDAA